MSVLINYYQYEGAENVTDILDSPLSIDGVGIEPKKTLDTMPKTTPYLDCPAFTHKTSREWIVYAPKDITLEIDNDNSQIICKQLNAQELNRTVQVQNKRAPITTLQVCMPMLICWTKNKNIWVEVKDYPLTSLNNNFTVVQGWFNLSSWTRPISFGLNIVDNTKPVIIKRGDPLYKINFIQEGNLNQDFRFEKAMPSEDLLIQMNKRVRVKGFINNLAKTLMFKQCPFK